MVAMAKKKTVKKAARSSKTASRASSVSKTASKVVKKVVKKKPASRPESKPAVSAAKKPTKVVKPLPEPEPEAPTRKKGVRKATLTTGVRDTGKLVRKLGRSRIPIDAPLDVVFQNDMLAREAFVLLGVHSIRELEQFNPDDLVMRLTAPAKLTVGRIRKILAMNNRCLSGDEEFALEFQERLAQC